MSARVDTLLAEVAALVAKPDLARTAPTDEERRKARARERFAALVQESGRTQREFAEQLLGVDESAVRRAITAGLGLPIPWWLEALIEEHPELVATWISGVLHDVRTSINARRAAGG